MDKIKRNFSQQLVKKFHNNCFRIETSANPQLINQRAENHKSANSFERSTTADFADLLQQQSST